ncbi:MAG: cupin domain-containing protein [Thermodesulfobacteriota bacterium]
MGNLGVEMLVRHPITPWDEQTLLEAYEILIQPQARFQGHFFMEKRQELGYLLEGELMVEIGGRAFRMGVGDCVRLTRDTPQGWQNPLEVRARLFWIIIGG